MENVNFIGFVDDHTIIGKFQPTNGMTTERDCITKLETQMEKVTNWMKEMRLKINPNKTEFIYFGSKTSRQNTSITHFHVSKDMVPATDTIKLLGVKLDDHLTMKKFIECDIKKLQMIQNMCISSD